MGGTGLPALPHAVAAGVLWAEQAPGAPVGMLVGRVGPLCKEISELKIPKWCLPVQVPAEQNKIMSGCCQFLSSHVESQLPPASSRGSLISVIRGGSGTS